jgi:AraC family transcriptional regulator
MSVLNPLMATSDFGSATAISPAWHAIAEELTRAAIAARTGDARALSAHVERAQALVQRQSISAEHDVLALWRRKRILNYIDAHLPDTLRIAELAQQVGLSTSHLSRVFKSHFGLSLGAYVRRQRMARAREIMLTTSKPLAEIALECGLADQSHFTRVFRCSMGETPGRWRARELGLLPETRWTGLEAYAAYESRNTNPAAATS